MKRLVCLLIVLCGVLPILARADGAEWVKGKIKSLNPIKQIIIITPQDQITDDAIIAISVDENTVFTDVESFNRLKVGQKLEVEIYDDETSPKKMAREVKLITPPSIPKTEESPV